MSFVDFQIICDILCFAQKFKRCSERNPNVKGRRSLPILQTTTNSQTTMWTKQNYYSYAEQPLFGTLHSTKVLYTFLQNYYYLIIKPPFPKQKRTIGSYTNKKVLLSRDNPCFFPAFLFFDETIFLKLTRTA